MNALSSGGGASGLRSEKILLRHQSRLAVVYVRQSTVQQVLEHQESTRLQYGLVRQAEAWGWPAERVEVIDEDLGKSGASAQGRSGFQRLVSEVGLGHVGLILGVEMSRLARSSTDWHQLLELCALFGTLIADLDGIYDPAEYNDRLLLGLKGTMSEAELHLLRQRMYQGKLNKARRGELGFVLPTGYVRDSAGEIVFDPDAQVQEVVRLIFRKFEELGTLSAVLRYLVAQGIELGFRVREKVGRGELEWHRPNRMTLQNLLKHPLYAGAYVYGRRQRAPGKRPAGGTRSGRVVCAPEQWHVLRRDAVPAYISWEQYERNQARLKANQARAGERGAVRPGAALLAGVLVCGRCGSRMTVSYPGPGSRYTYVCSRRATDYGEAVCQQLAGGRLDAYVSQWVLRALEPAALELALEASEHLEREREELLALWQQRRERAAYEAERAARQYQRVEPENRLVARQLESAWEEKLRAQQKLEEDYHRFLQQQPRRLRAAEQAAIRGLAHDIPMLWAAPSTTSAERKEILRQLIERVEIAVQGESEQVRVHIEWVGGHCSEGAVARPVARWEQLSSYAALCTRVQELSEAGHSAAEIAERLQAEGYHPPKRGERVGRQGVLALQKRLGLRAEPSRSVSREGLREHEWWVPVLAQELQMPEVTLYHWIRRGWARARQQETPPRRWIVFADAAELRSLRERRQRPSGYYTRRRWTEGNVPCEEAEVGG